MKLNSLFLILTLICAPTVAHALSMDMGIVAFIESTNNPKAFNKAKKAIGLYQITPICLKEWNNYHPRKQYTSEDLWNKEINTEIGTWYMQVRIPQMLKYFKKPDTAENRIISYNAGIEYVVKGLPLPQDTKDYIVKYNNRLVSETGR